MARSRTCSARATPTSPTRPSTASATTAAAAGRARGRRRSRVAAGAIARKVLGPEVAIRGCMVQIGPHPIDREQLGLGRDRAQSLLVPGRRRRRTWEEPSSTRSARRARRSAASSRWWPSGVPAGLGEPIYDKLDADLAKALMCINAVKGVEIGDGFAAAALCGEENNDEMRMRDDGSAVPLQPCRRHPGRHLLRPGHRRALRGQADLLGPDPTPHHRPPRRRGRDRDQGTARPCVGIRAVPVGEAMVASSSPTTCCATAGSTAPADPTKRQPHPVSAERSGCPKRSRRLAARPALVASSMSARGHAPREL